MTDNKSLTNAKHFTAGIIAGPFFVVGSVLHGLMREGFDMVRHPASLLSLGNWGWVQIATFVLSGLLYIAFAINLRRVLTSGTGRRWLSPLFIILGVALIAGGVFIPDPSLGFPAGTAVGVPKEMSWHSMIHGLAPIVGSLALLAAQLIFARRFGSQGQRAWMWITIIVAIGTFILSSLPSLTADWEKGRFNFIPLWVGVAISYGYTSIIIAKLKKELLIKQ